MNAVIDFRTTDQHEHSPLPAEGALEFTPEQTPDETRAWLAKLRHDREQQTRERTGE